MGALSAARVDYGLLFVSLSFPQRCLNLARFFRGVLVVSVDDGDVGDPDEAKNGAQVGLVEIVGGGGAVEFKAASAGTGDEEFFSVNEGNEALFAELESLSTTDDLVDIRFELGRNAEVVDRHGRDNEVSGEKLLDVGIRGRQSGATRLGLGLGWGKDADDPVQRDGSRWIGTQIAMEDGFFGMVGFPSGDKFCGEGVGDGSSATGAGVEMQE